MTEAASLGLFEGYGIELEYMIVDRDSLAVRPLTDQVLRQVAGEIVNEVEAGALRWSNELVMHVLELKTNGPAERLKGLGDEFQNGIRQVNEQLSGFNAQLLGTAMHPWMDPQRETVLWPYDNREIYDAYDRIFGCQGHGWSNLQSMHINLPFAGDAEFGRLHAAIRLILPLLPALAASSPIVDGVSTGLLDNRLEFYRQNQKNVPEIAGQVIPEAAYTRQAYQQQILATTYRAIAPYDPEGLLQDEWLNSRGAIARFDRNAIEIRVIDVQECPRADLAIAAIVVALARALCEERWASLDRLQAIAVEPLAAIFQRSLREGGACSVSDRAFLDCLGVPEASVSLDQLWQTLYLALQSEIPAEYCAPLELILNRGSLSRRILGALPKGFGRIELAEVYSRLSKCLQLGEMFDG